MEDVTSRQSLLDQLAAGSSLANKRLLDLDLSGLDFAEQDFSGASLSGANLKETRFIGARFAETGFSGAQASSASFEDSRFSATHFRSVDLSKSSFRSCRFESSGFIKSNLTLAVFVDVEFEEGISRQAVLNGASFRHCRFIGHSFRRTEAEGLHLIACRLDQSFLERLEMRAGSLAGTIVAGAEIDGCDFSNVDLRGADLSQATIVERHGANIFRGAQYNSLSKFPDGFDPDAVGMVRVADFTSEEAAQLLWRQAANNGGADAAISSPGLPVVEGLFLQEDAINHLGADVESIAARVNGATWPPTGYEGAQADAELALKIEELLERANEGSSIDSKYYAFVLAPGAEMPGEEEALNNQVDATLAGAAELLGVSVEDFGSDEEEDEDDKKPEDDGESTIEESSRTIFLHPDAEELEQQNKNWWTEFYDQAEYEARKAASQFMFDNLSDVRADQIPYEAAWNHAIYWGTSESGARVGVMATRFDEDDE